jgi:hypothetical protein
VGIVERYSDMTGQSDVNPQRSSDIGGHHGIIVDAFRLKSLVVLVGTAIGLYLCYRLSLPFLSALTWALVLAIMLALAHRWIETRVGDPLHLHQFQ